MYAGPNTVWISADRRSRLEYDGSDVNLYVDDVLEQSFGDTKIVAAGATLSVVRATHRGKIVTFDQASGSVITLPAATGSGDRYEFVVTTTVGSNNHILKVANASDTMVGVLTTATTTTGAGTHEAAGGTDDTITMNGDTGGGIVGSHITAVDVAANVWLVNGHLVGSGSLESPLSATVS